MADTLADHKSTVSIGGRTISNLRFTDDIDGLAGSEIELANLMACPDDTSTAYGMEISTEKTKLMTNNTNGISSKIRVNGEELETVQSFKYSGAIVTEIQDCPNHSSTPKAQDHLGRQEHRPQLKDQTVALLGHVHIFIFL